MADIIEKLRERAHFAREEGTGTADADASYFDASANEIERLRKAISDIKQATLDGRVCDDVAWFDTITTLHDFCDLVLTPAERPVIEDAGKEQS